MLRGGPRHALAPPRAALLKRPHLVRAGGLRPRRDASRLPHADSLAAIGVAGPIAVAGYRLVRATIDAPVDRVPRGTDRRYASSPKRRESRGRRRSGFAPAAQESSTSS